MVGAIDLVTGGWLRALRRPALVSRAHRDYIPRNRRMDGIV